jgi:hypothetical protein
MGKEKKALSLKEVTGQCKISFNRVMWFLKISISLNTKLAAKTHLVAGDFYY